MTSLSLSSKRQTRPKYPPCLDITRQTRPKYPPCLDSTRQTRPKYPPCLDITRLKTATVSLYGKTDRIFTHILPKWPVLSESIQSRQSPRSYSAKKTSFCTAFTMGCHGRIRRIQQPKPDGGRAQYAAVFNSHQTYEQMVSCAL